jgi:hypothetical protein
MPISLQAEMIGTDRIAATAATDSKSESVARFIQRPEVAAQLEAMGLSATVAQDRVAAMTPEEIDQIAGQIESLPAGADSSLSLSGSSWLIFVIIALIAFVIWAKYYQAPAKAG